MARVAEGTFAAVAGAGLSGLAAIALGAPVSMIVPIAAAGGANGAIGGALQVYDWAQAKGWVAFLLDSTWGLLGSSLGLIVHLFNLVATGSGYRGDHSRRRNRHVYERGFKLRRGFVVTMGNVISNATGENVRIEDKPNRLGLIDEHEDLHVWQSRSFGVVMQTTYVLWSIGGVAFGSLYWLAHRDESFGSIIETTAYYDNPFEYWAYRHHGYWPPAGSHPRVRWPGRAA